MSVGEARHQVVQWHHIISIKQFTDKNKNRKQNWLHEPVPHGPKVALKEIEMMSYVGFDGGKKTNKLPLDYKNQLS